MGRRLCLFVPGEVLLRCLNRAHAVVCVAVVCVGLVAAGSGSGERETPVGAVRVIRRACLPLANNAKRSLAGWDGMGCARGHGWPLGVRALALGAPTKLGMAVAAAAALLLGLHPCL